MYLTETDVKKIFELISKTFRTTTVYVETMNPFIVKNIKEKSIDKSQAKFTWGIKNGKVLAEMFEQYEGSITARELTAGGKCKWYTV